MTNARRLGMNLGTVTFYDSGQMMRNITFLNPGFEGEQWQSILHCVKVTATSCTDDNLYTSWPANFLKGGAAEFLVGDAAGTTATVTSSTTASVSGGYGVTINLSGVSIAPSEGDFVVVRMEVPGNAQAGWGPSLSSGASVSTEFKDLSPNSPGKQALRVTVPAGESAVVATYMDDLISGRSFLQMKGGYTLTFRAKSTGGSDVMNISLQRPGATFLNKNITLTNSWQDYCIPMTNYDNGATGALALKFSLYGASILLDDVALTEAPEADNPTAFRNEVVDTLRTLHPGTLRYMDSGQNWGSSIENMLAVDFARERVGYSNWSTESVQIPLGLHDFLVLCQTVGTEPWYTLQTGMSTEEMSNLMDYLGGSTSTEYGAKRAALGQTVPWTTVFPMIHLEFGNEVWNTANPGALIDDATAYGTRASKIFSTAKASSAYTAKKFDLIVDGFQVVPSWNQQVLAAANPNYDTIDVATYFYSSFNDDSSIEKIFGPMFAEPEAINSTPGSIMQQQAIVAASAPKRANLAVYETQIAVGNGTASQTGVNNTQPSVGGGIAEADNMLLAMRDLGVNDQNMFALGGYQFNFYPTPGAANTATTTQLFGSVVDIGGQSNLQRPNFLGLQLANSAILPTLLTTSQTGANPTWNQPLSTNDNVSLNGAHYIQSFAFTDGNKLNVALFNLSRTTALPVTFAGLNAPLGAATVSTLTAPAITASNESTHQVAISGTTMTLEAGSKVTLPPYSMTVISVAAPVIPIAINSITINCPRSSLSPKDTMACTDSVVGQGKYNSGVTWSVDSGTIDNTGNYIAPSTVPASGMATVKVTSVQDTTKSATFPISLAVDSVTGVTVTCGATSLGWGTSTSCSASVAGTGSYSNAYTWSVSGGSITSMGNLTAPTTGTSVTVTATSTQDTSKSGGVKLTLTPVLSISGPVTTSVTSTSITVGWTNSLAARNGVQYNAAAAASGASTPFDATYTTSPSFTLTGLKPATAYNLVLVAYNDTQHTYKQITVATPSTTTSSSVTGVKVSCGSSSIVLGGSASCSALVSGTNAFSKTYTWSVSSGSISSAGVVTAPNSGTSLTVKATSVEDPTKSGTFTIALSPADTITGVTVHCPAATLAQGKTTACTAAVAGTGSFSTATIWSVSAGSISSAGVVDATAAGTVIVTATSTVDQTKAGSFTITVTPAMTITNPKTTTTSSSITVSWTVSVAARNGVQYSTPSAGSSTPFDPTYTTSPSFTITGLLPGTTYNLLLISYTDTQNTSKPVTVTTAGDSSGSVSAVTVNCAAHSLVQGGKTSCSAVVAGAGSYSSAVKWTGSAGSVSSSGAVTASQSGTSMTVTATSVQNPAKFSTVTLTLTPVTMAISDPKASVTSTSITVSWKVNELARSGVDWFIGNQPANSTPFNPTYSTSPGYTISGLKSGTVYNLRLVCYNESGNTTKTIQVTTAKE